MIVGMQNQKEKTFLIIFSKCNVSLIDVNYLFQMLHLHTS